MNDRRVAAIVRREWRELARTRGLLVGSAMFPLVLVAVAVGLLLTAGAMELEPEELGELSSQMPDSFSRLEPRLAAQVLLNEQMVILFLLLPAALPVGLAAHTLIHEKVTRSLEPLLASPVRTEEILLAKALAYCGPAVLLAWLSYALFALVAFFAADPVVFAYLVRPAWPLGLVLVSPPMAVLSTLIGVLISARARDPQAAQVVGGLLVVPVVVWATVTLLGVVLIDERVLGGAAGALLVLDGIVLRVAVRLFSREQILTRWR